MKLSPKSCSCQQCTRGKHSPGGQIMLKADERSLRHSQKIKLDAAVKYSYNIDSLEDLNIDVVPIGNYYD